MKEVGGGGKETLQMIRDDTEKLKLGYLNQAVLFWVSALFIITTNKGPWARLCTSVFPQKHLRPAHLLTVKKVQSA